jgi:HD-GYP domain-containing protein (c-di-GMP phosphodiesterase class II)
MIDSDQLQGLISSLSRISSLSFQLWDANGLVFSTGADGAKEDKLQEHRALSSRIMTEAAYRYASSHGQEPMFGVPIRYGQTVIGSLIAYQSNSCPKSQSKDGLFLKTLDAEDMEAFLTHLVGLLEEKWASHTEVEEMAEELSQTFEGLSLYGRISTHLRSAEFCGAVLKDLMEELPETLRVDLAFIQMPRREEYNITVSAKGLLDRIPHQKVFANSLIKAIPPSAPSLEQDYFIVNDSTTTPVLMKLHPDPYRFLAVKVGHNSHFDGWLGLVSFNMEEIFRQGELKLLQSIARQISVLLANTDLYQELQHFVINMVKSLVYAIEAKDIYTRGHSERVSRYSMLIADRLELDETQKEALNWASILHDIGKIGIPETVLNKSGPLDDHEFEIIKAHSEKGHNILEPLKQLSDSLQAILHHHERYDGTGYPHGLKGQEIPLSARIIAVADTFDAMTSDRAYRSSTSPEEALSFMEQVAGSQLDLHLVEVFKEVYRTVLKEEFETSHDEKGGGDKAIDYRYSQSQC